MSKTRNIPVRLFWSPRLFVAFVFCCSIGAAVAQTSIRMLPPEAMKGEMSPPEMNRVVINGKSYGLAPGLRLRDTANVIVFPNSVKESVTVRYTIDPMGLVDRIWILTSAEKVMPDQPIPVVAAPQ